MDHSFRKNVRRERIQARVCDKCHMCVFGESEGIMVREGGDYVAEAGGMGSVGRDWEEGV